MILSDYSSWFPIITQTDALYQNSLLLPSPLPWWHQPVKDYLFLYSEHINHIQVFGFLPLPYLSHAWLLSLPCMASIPPIHGPLRVTHVQYYYICFRCIICTWENMWVLTFWAWLTSLKMMFSWSVHLPVYDKISFFFVQNPILYNKTSFS
jgi:hypothetical protein